MRRGLAGLRQMALAWDAADFSRTAADPFQSCPNTSLAPEDTQVQLPAADLRCRSLKLSMKLLRRCDLPCTSRLKSSTYRHPGRMRLPSLLRAGAADVRIFRRKNLSEARSNLWPSVTSTCSKLARRKGPLTQRSVQQLEQATSPSRSVIMRNGFHLSCRSRLVLT
jgi:hypothetical protein